MTVTADIFPGFCFPVFSVSGLKVSFGHFPTGLVPFRKTQSVLLLVVTFFFLITRVIHESVLVITE